MRIIQLPDAASASPEDVFVININGVDYQATGETLAAMFQAAGDYLTTSDVANNLTTTAAGKVLDARQGKALADAITAKLSKEIDRSSFSDLNNNSLMGHAVLNDKDWSNLPPKLAGTNEEWYDVYLFGFIQMAISYINRGMLWFRTCTNNVWGDWVCYGGKSIVGTSTTVSGLNAAANQLVRNGQTCTVFLFINLSTSVPGNNAIVATIPEVFRPSSIRYVSGFVSSIGLTHFFAINTDGTIKTATTSNTYSATGYILISGTYTI